MEAHETQEQIEQAEHRNNRRAALLIIILAAILAIVDMAGKHAQTAATTLNIESSDLWSFYQAKTVRQTVLRTAIETAGLAPGSAEDAARQQQIAAWKSTIDRYESDPATGEGRVELSQRAKATAAERDHELAAYHDFEYAAAALQIAIVVASAAVLTETMALEFVSLALGLAAIGFAGLGWFAPEMLRL